MQELRNTQQTCTPTLDVRGQDNHSCKGLVPSKFFSVPPHQCKLARIASTCPPWTSLSPLSLSAQHPHHHGGGGFCICAGRGSVTTNIELRGMRCAGQAMTRSRRRLCMAQTHSFLTHAPLQLPILQIRRLDVMQPIYGLNCRPATAPGHIRHGAHATMGDVGNVQ